MADDKDNSYTVKPKPKFRMKSSSSSSHQRSGLSSEAISKPTPTAESIAAKKDQSTVEIIGTKSSEDDGRPKSRKGPMLPGKNTKGGKSMSPPRTTASGSSVPDILTLDGPSVNEGADTSSTTVRKDSRRFERRAHVVIDGGDDDILSSMGLDDGEMTNKSNLFTVHNKTQPPRIPDSHGKPTLQRKTKTATNTQDGESVGEELPFKGEKTVDEGSYMFGGYTPSVMSGPRQIGLPTNISSRGRHSLETHSQPTVTLSSQSDNEKRNTTKPRQQQEHSEAVKVEAIVEPRDKPARKSVRFAGVLDSTTNYSSSHEVKTEHKALFDDKTAKESSLQVPQAEVLSLAEDRMLNLKEKDPEPKLEHPVFPWQLKEKKRDLDDHNSVNPLHTQSTSQRHSTPTLTKTESKGKTNHSNDTISLQRSSPERHHSREDSEESDKSSVKIYSKDQMSNPDTIFREDRKQNDDLKSRVKSLENQLETSEQQRKSLTDRLEDEKRDREQRSVQSKELELTSHLEELRIKVSGYEIAENCKLTL